MEAKLHQAYDAEYSRLQSTVDILKADIDGTKAQYAELKETVDTLLRTSGGEYDHDLVSKSA
ncbi:MAG TPA: hypothetical protein DD782_01460, partial [Firmicutes bacterium]|nr:hypothetical protein [Bacillota bacterium]